VRASEANENQQVGAGPSDKKSPAGGERKEDVMDKAKVVTALITNERTKFTEDDREWLKALEDAQLEKLQACAEAEKPREDIKAAMDKTNEDLGLKPKEGDDDSQKAPEKKEPDEETVETFIAKAPAEVRSVLSRSVRREETMKAELIKGLMANKRNRFTEEQLKTKDLDELEYLAELAQVEVQEGAVKAAEDKNRIPAPPPVVLAAAGDSK
jgi:hypothetical protein